MRWVMKVFFKEFKKGCISNFKVSDQFYFSPFFGKGFYTFSDHENVCHWIFFCDLLPTLFWGTKNKEWHDWNMLVLHIQSYLLYVCLDYDCGLKKFVYLKLVSSYKTQFVRVVMWRLSRQDFSEIKLDKDFIWPSCNETPKVCLLWINGRSAHGARMGQPALGAQN